MKSRLAVSIVIAALLASLSETLASDRIASHVLSIEKKIELTTINNVKDAGSVCRPESIRRKD